VRSIGTWLEGTVIDAAFIAAASAFEALEKQPGRCSQSRSKMASSSTRGRDCAKNGCCCGSLRRRQYLLLLVCQILREIFSDSLWGHRQKTLSVRRTSLPCGVAGKVS